MRIARIAALIALLLAGRGALAEDLSGKLAELERGAAPPSDKVQIVPGVDQPQLVPARAPAPEPEPALEPEPADEPEGGDELMQDPDAAPEGTTNGGGIGMTVEPRVENSSSP